MNAIDDTVDAALNDAQNHGRWPVRFPAIYLGKAKERIIQEYSTTYLVHEQYDKGHYIEFRPKER